MPFPHGINIIQQLYCTLSSSCMDGCPRGCLTIYCCGSSHGLWSQPASVVVEGKIRDRPHEYQRCCLGITHTTPVPQRYPQLDMEHRRFLRPRRFVGIPVDHITVKFWSSDKSQEPKSKRLGALGIVDHTVAPPAFLFERRIK